MQENSTICCINCGKDFAAPVSNHPICQNCSAMLARASRSSDRGPYPVASDSSILLIPLTQSQVAIIDSADAHLVTDFRWYAVHRRPDKFAAKGRVNGSYVFMHRYLLDFPEESVDHIDGNPLNNRRSNLREATSAQNNANRGTWRYRTIPKGVQQVRGGKYVARIGSNNRVFHLGTFDTAEDAAKAYNDAAEEQFGEFAYRVH